MVVSGGVVSTVHAFPAGAWSTFPARSTARTEKVCDPSARPLYAAGGEQPVKAAPSNEHSKIASSLATKLKTEEPAFVSEGGPESSKVSGAVLSIAIEAESVASFPAVSTAVAATVAGPSPRELVDQLNSYGGVESIPTSQPLTRNSTRSSPLLSLAAAATTIEPRARVPASGLVSDTAGGSWSASLIVQV